MLSICLCVSIPNNVRERQMSVTHRLLVKLLLFLDVWDLPMLPYVRRTACDGHVFEVLRMPPAVIRGSCSRWQNHCSTITITSTY